ncbi:MAG: N-acetylmuramoyl-L-alanine amidase [Pirellulales bacterium]
MRWFERARHALRSGSTFLVGNSGGKRQASRRRVARFEPLEPRLTLAAAGLVPVGSQPTGTLSGKIVYTSGGHGWDFLSGGWTTDRPNLNGMIESFGNQDQIAYYADYLLRAGATVVPMRPVGRQINEVVLDNDMPQVTFTGSWSNSTTGTRWYDEDYGVGADPVRYRFANVDSSAETASATYTPNIPQAGFYPIYTWVTPGTNRTSQLYKINHTGGQTQIRVDHRLVGNGWVYLGTYHFDAGSSTAEGSVVISNHSTGGGSVVIADAIRFGNGMGDLPRDGSGFGSGSTSGQPREDEASIFWVYRGLGQGATPSTVLGTSNVNAPLRMAAHMNASPYGTSVYISFHSNAFNSTARGAVGLVHSSNPTPNQSSLATFAARQIDVDMRAQDGQFEHTWQTRSYTLGGSYGEITNVYAAGEFDATIIEVAFHDNVQDAQLLRDPKVRDQIGRSVYEATLEYFRLVSSTQPANTTLPSAPTNVRAVSNASGQVTVSWAAGPSSSGVGGVFGNAATGFRIFASSDGYGFDGGTFVSGGAATSATLSGYDPTLPYYFKVVAENAGGQSKASEIVTALPSGGANQVLIVNGFDRLDRFGNIQYTSLPPRSTGVSDRVWSRYNNSFDYVVQVHTAIDAAKPGIRVASTSNEAVISGAVNLADYHTVIWILGEESTTHETFNATEQTKVEQFIAGGGNLFVTGSEIAWDLDRPSGPTAADRTFFETTLQGNYAADDANTYNVTAAAGGIFTGLPNFGFSSGSAFSSLDSQMYNVDRPDVISPQSGAQLALNYSGGVGGGAAIQVEGTGGRGSMVMFGFPFETITSAARRIDVIDRVFEFFDLSANMPAVEIETFVNGQDADSGPGPTLAAGGTATFTYSVTNTGNVALESVVVVDDNGTPGNTADDFNATLDSGDINGNNLLDLGETWTFSATPIVTAGPYTGLGTVTAEDSIGEVVTDADGANYFGSAPGINVKKFVNAEDADTPTGPVVAVGGTATFVYVVTNTGNVPLANVAVLDDNGTPGNTADDFNATYSGGDTDLDSKLDQSETWIYVAMRVVTAGQHTNIGTASGEDIIGQIATDDDPANYFGDAPENADFNGDGTVDAADYVIWRKYSGASVPAGTLGDADQNGEVNSLDYDIWQSQFGTSPGAGSSGASPISEPSTAMAAPAMSGDAFVLPTEDVIFSTIAVGPGARRFVRRPLSQLAISATSRAFGGDWDALLTNLAERKAYRSTADPLRLSIESRVGGNESLAAEWQAGVETLVPIFSAKFSRRGPR